MNDDLTYQEVKAQFSNPNWNCDFIENRQIDLNEKTAIIEIIIDKLDSKDIGDRYIASHMIIEFKLFEAKSKLIERILDPDTRNSNGTMTYALEHLNCANNLVDIFKILATQTYESQWHAYNVLNEQIFEFTSEDLDHLEHIWEEVQTRQIEGQIYEKAVMEMIKDAYIGFINYREN